MTEEQERFGATNDDHKRLIEPYDVIVTAHHGAVRLRLVYRTRQIGIADHGRIGVDMTPSETRMMAAHMIREADLAEKDVA